MVSKDSLKNSDCLTTHWTVSPGRLLDVVANTAFSSGNVQVELHHAITRLLVSFLYLYIINFDHFTLDHFILDPLILSMIYVYF